MQPIAPVGGVGHLQAVYHPYRVRLQRPSGDEQEARTEEVRELRRVDRDVRAHEAAHRAAGGSHAGPIALDLIRGPDGVLYAVGGEVSIDLSPVAGDPAATIQKMESVIRAALAPLQPSTQDRAVAGLAAALLADARAALAAQAEGAEGPTGSTSRGEVGSRAQQRTGGVPPAEDDGAVVYLPSASTVSGPTGQLVDLLV